MTKEVSSVKLSIITPYYNALDYIKELAKILEPQLKNMVEWIIIDDGCHEAELDKFNAIVVHLPNNSGGASKPRNIGLDIAKGKFIAFIDSDDTVSPDYIEKIFNSFYTKYDYCYLGWDSPHYTIVIEDQPPSWNCCVWNCIYKKSLIGSKRFDEGLVIGEDYEFNNKVRIGIHHSIREVLYHYHDTPNSLIKRGN